MTNAIACVGDLVDAGEAEVKTGPFGTQLKASDYVERGTPVINVRNIGFGSIREDKLEYINESTTARLHSHLLQVGDLVFGRKGAVERHAFISSNAEGWLQGSDCLRLRIVTPRRALPRFLSYVFLTQQHQRWMQQQCSHGATMASLNQDIIRRIPLELPPLDTQQRIADILSAYDDLIENNTRRIAILEEMARRLYEEWFVHFRFPGHEAAKFVDTPEGRLPEGWRRGRLRDVVVLQRGFDLPRKAREPGRAPIISATGATGTHRMSRVKGPGVVTGRSGSLGEVMYVQEDFWPLNTTLWGKEFPLGSPRLAFYLLRTIDLKGFNSGAAVPTLNRNDVHDLPITLPPRELLSLWDPLTDRLLRLQDSLRRQNANLRAQRDLLLPKLVSGEIDVSAVEEELSEAAE
ncbi:restriction endonuclease subunit S [Afifella sp. H1R]|uniref:restriction endonuclease subunit S n=1 Tax=Afifella sp. H1R TaxID=2908841 RepID=UPI001F2EC70D|nr:restriction endonuclease subunit S [Afifella sp. H1R]MCF1504024.1 restriction endonuclease subunit S [Afifella sp. H1R]